MKRINAGFFSRPEENILWRLVKKLPKWVTPDMLSYSALASAFFTGLFYIFAANSFYFLFIANLLILAHWFTDGLDGKLAKARNFSRPNYGYYLDHIFDALAVCFIFWGLYISGITNTFWPLVALFFFLLLMIQTYLLKRITGFFYLSIGGLGGTEARFILIIANIFCCFFRQPIFKLFSVDFYFFDLISMLLSVGLIGLFFYALVNNIRQLRKEKPERSAKVLH